MRPAIALACALVAGVSVAFVGACQRTPSAPATADCTRVAETLATFELGTNATPDQRVPVVAKYRAACESTHVTGAEAACLYAAKDTWAARACLPRMFAAPPASAVSAGCTTAMTRMREAVQHEIGSGGEAAMAAVDQMLPIYREACERDGWPAAVLDCIARTQPGDMTAFQTCANQLPADQQQKLAQRLSAYQQTRQAQQPAAPDTELPPQPAPSPPPAK